MGGRLIRGRIIGDDDDDGGGVDDGVAWVRGGASNVADDVHQMHDVVVVEFSFFFGHWRLALLVY
jgi:hypothetical protein